jgi:hypothetical protein
MPYIDDPLNMGGNKITSMAAGAAYNDGIRLGQTRQVYNVLTYGADPTGTSDSGPAFNDAVAALPSDGGVIYVPTGSYKIATTITIEIPEGSTIILKGDGYQNTVLLSYVTGDCVRMYGNTSATSWSVGSGVIDIGIDGTNAGNSSNGLHIGDFSSMKTEVYVQHFTGTSSCGILLDNTLSWTEQADMRATVYNCTTCVEFTVTTGSNSFGYGNFDFTIEAGNTQNGVVVTDGAFIYHGRLKMRGNSGGGSSTTTAAMLKVTGVAPVGSTSSGSISAIVSMNLDIMMECGSGTYTPQTIYMDATNYTYIQGCYGILDFGFGNQYFTPATTTAGQIQFTGLINGDTNLAPNMYTSYWRNSGVATTYSVPQVALYEAYCDTTTSDCFSIALNGNYTVDLNPGGNTFGIPQKVLFVITQASSGGPYTLTWPTEASPTTTNPTVVWLGNVPPALQTAANAVDVVELVTYNGATWYGKHVYPYTEAPSVSNIELQRLLSV